MRVITYEQIKEINRLYAELKTYAAVSRAMGIAPSTVKKYVKANYEVPDESGFQRFDRPLPEQFNVEIFLADDWGKLCELTREEKKAVEDLWKELYA